MSRWFRVYDDLIDDPKVQCLPPSLFKALVNLWCIACQNGGILPTIDQIGFKLRMSKGQTDTILAGLREAGLVDDKDGTSSPHNWAGRQFKSDDPSPRVQRHRERQRNVTSGGTGNVTSGGADGVSPDVTETPPEKTDTDTDRQTERKKERKQGGRATRAAANGHSTEDFAFRGAIIRLNRGDYDRWKTAYSSLEGFDAALQKADDYYRDHPPKDGKWFFPVSRWLEKENTEASSRSKEAARGVDRW